MRRKTVFLLALVVALVGESACAGTGVSSPDDNKTWLSPGKIRITDLRSGDTVKQRIAIHNGNDAAVPFVVYYRIPDYVEEGFSAAPANAREWVTVTEATPVLAPRETKQIEIVLDLPADAMPPARWEFWIGVREKADATVAGVAMELAGRWLITMKAP
jgi:hypothetical protein